MEDRCTTVISLILPLTDQSAPTGETVSYLSGSSKPMIPLPAHTRIRHFSGCGKFASTTHRRPPTTRSAAEYDALTADHDYERWLFGARARSPTATDCAGRRLLDLACGTGPQLRADAAPRLRRHRLRRLAGDGARRAPARAGRAVEVADMRALPDWGRLRPRHLPRRRASTTCRTSPTSTPRSPASHASLRPGGLFVFDLNSLLTYRTAFTSTFTVDAGDVQFDGARRGGARTHRPARRARAASRSAPASRTEAGTAGSQSTPSATGRRTPCARACAPPDCDPVALHGQTTGCVLHETVDETARDTKVILVARRD